MYAIRSYYVDYEYGTNIDLTFIDVNEKLDRIAEYLPDISRPQVIRNNFV